MSKRANTPDISPVLTDSTVRPSALGIPEMMLARMIMEIPLPIPRSVTCSPSHNKNIVPVVMVTVAMNRNDQPEVSTMPPFCSATDAPSDWNTASTNVK
jgi:hypothetical protein